MQCPEPPYPPGYQLPGIGFFLLIGVLTLCFVGIVLYLVFTGRIQVEAEKYPHSSLEAIESGGAAKESESQEI